MPRSPRRTARPACPRPSSRCTRFWRIRPTASPTGGSRAPEINYRRFFDINQLAGLRMEQGEVFEATHRLLLRLIAEGKVQGVRLDHIDGMYDPRGYCQRLLSRVADVLAESRDGERPEIDARAAAGRSTCWSRRSSPATRACARTCRSPAPPATSSSAW